MSINLINVSHSYDSKNYVLKDFSLNINKGEIVAIIGSSGSGKSTLLNIVGGNIEPMEGEVLLNGTDISKLSPKQFEKFKLENIGYIFQNFNLIPYLNVIDNVLLPAILLKKNKNDYKGKAIDLLKKLNLEEKIDGNILELSGGQQQRVAIARALLLDPCIILADEPTGSLDRKNSDNFMEMLKKVATEDNVSVMLVTHDLKVSKYATKVVDISK
jgi:ABC-type lipoprotein export system ATPase subunit